MLGIKLVGMRVERLVVIHTALVDAVKFPRHIPLAVVIIDIDIDFHAAAERGRLMYGDLPVAVVAKRTEIQEMSVPSTSYK